MREDRWTVRESGRWGNEATITTSQDTGTVTAEIVWAAPGLQGVVYMVDKTVKCTRLAEM